MLQPNRVKYRMIHRGHVRGKASTGNTLAFGDYGLQSLDAAEGRAIVHYLRRGVMLWIRVFPDKPLTKKPAETRMGSGKGALDHWVAVVRPGNMVFEISGVKEDAARAAFRLAAHKLSIETKVVVKGAD